MTAYYNEIDPHAAQWLRNLIAAGHIAPGEVDTRSIADVRPDDLAGYTQCHFFAGIGVWSYALRLAGWPDDRPVWTGSCPCQPFSAAGKGKGGADDRHLWPVWFNLIRECQPGVVFGEQVEAAIRHGWLDLVQTDMEGVGYAVGAVGLPAAGFGAPHIRQRLWFVADAISAGAGRHTGTAPCEEKGSGGARRADGVGCGDSPIAGGAVRRMADTTPRGFGVNGGAPGSAGHAALGNAVGLLGDTEHEGLAQRVVQRGVHPGAVGAPAGQEPVGPGVHRRPGPTNGHWRDADWIFCRDGKWRPVEPGTFPLAHGTPARVGRLRGYGNAIAAPVAVEVIGAYLDCRST